MLFKLYAVGCALMSLISFLLMGLDKRFAKKRTRRIPEKVLLGVSLFGGSIGGGIAMRLFHHKVRRQAFAVGLPIMMLVHIIIGLVLLFKFAL